jgi:hypothetical protein
MSKLILLAAATLVAGTAAKPFTVGANEELTDAKLKKLGLDAANVKDLIDRGLIVETEVREAAPDAPADTAALDAANKRADDAEAKVKELEAALAEATKPPAPPAAQ